MFVLKKIELFENSILLHREERIEGNSTLDAIVALFLQGEVLSEIDSVRRVGLGCSGTICYTKLVNRVYIGLFQVKWIVSGGHVGTWSDDVTESDFGVGELGAEKTVHVRVVTRYFEVAPEHLD